MGTPRFLYSYFYALYKLTSLLSFLGFGALIFGAHPKEERQYRHAILEHQHSQHRHAIHHELDDPQIIAEMAHEREEIASLSHSFSHLHLSDFGVYLLFYGMYFGVLARDLASLCCDWISNALGFFNPSGFPRRRVPTNICAVCNNPLTNHEIGIF